MEFSNCVYEFNQFMKYQDEVYSQLSFTKGLFYFARVEGIQARYFDGEFQEVENQDCEDMVYIGLEVKYSFSNNGQNVLINNLKVIFIYKNEIYFF